MFLAVDDKKPEEPKDDSKKKLKKTKSEISEPEIKPAETQPPADQEKPMSELEKRRAEMEKRKKEQAELEGLFRLHCFLNKFTSFKNIWIRFSTSKSCFYSNDNIERSLNYTVT